MMTNREAVDVRLSKNNIMVKYVNENNIKLITKPVLKFSHVFQEYPKILEEIQKETFAIPSPVQCQTWPINMTGHNLIAIAQTETVLKTSAFFAFCFYSK